MIFHHIKIFKKQSHRYSYRCNPFPHARAQPEQKEEEEKEKESTVAATGGSESGEEEKSQQDGEGGESSHTAKVEQDGIAGEADAMSTTADGPQETKDVEVLFSQSYPGPDGCVDAPTADEILARLGYPANLGMEMFWRPATPGARVTLSEIMQIYAARLESTERSRFLSEQMVTPMVAPMAQLPPSQDALVRMEQQRLRREQQEIQMQMRAQMQMQMQEANNQRELQMQMESIKRQQHQFWLDQQRLSEATRRTTQTLQNTIPAERPLQMGNVDPGFAAPSRAAPTPSKVSQFPLESQGMSSLDMARHLADEIGSLEPQDEPFGEPAQDMAYPTFVAGDLNEPTADFGGGVERPIEDAQPSPITSARYQIEGFKRLRESKLSALRK